MEDSDEPGSTTPKSPIPTSSPKSPVQTSSPKSPIPTSSPKSPIPSSSSSDSNPRVQSALQSLSTIITPPPSSFSDPSLSSTIYRHLHLPSSGAGDDNLCRWLYDTFQSTDPFLQLIVLRFIPTIAGLYLSRSSGRRRHLPPLAGFEAVLLALYAHQTLARDNKPLTIDFPNLSFPSPYHEATKTTAGAAKPGPGAAAAESCIAETAIISETLIPHGTVRSTKRARIVGVALELYYSRIPEMPVESKREFCRFAADWAGHRSEEEKEGEEKGKRIAMPWELLRPVMRIVGHCLLGLAGSGEEKEEELKKAAEVAATALYERALHDMDSVMVLATRSLVKVGMGKMAKDAVYSPPEMASVYSSAAEAAVAGGDSES